METMESQWPCPYRGTPEISPHLDFDDTSMHQHVALQHKPNTIIHNGMPSLYAALLAPITSIIATIPRLQQNALATKIGSRPLRARMEHRHLPLQQVHLQTRPLRTQADRPNAATLHYTTAETRRALISSSGTHISRKLVRKQSSHCGAQTEVRQGVYQRQSGERLWWQGGGRGLCV